MFAPTQAEVRKGLGGTAYMEVSPLKGVKLPESRVESESSSDLSATIRLPELSDRPIQEVSGPRPARTNCGADPVRSMTVVGSVPQYPASRIQST